MENTREGITKRVHDILAAIPANVACTTSTEAPTYAITGSLALAYDLVINGGQRWTFTPGDADLICIPAVFHALVCRKGPRTAYNNRRVRCFLGNHEVDVFCAADNASIVATIANFDIDGVRLYVDRMHTIHYIDGSVSERVRKEFSLVLYVHPDTLKNEEEHVNPHYSRRAKYCARGFTFLREEIAPCVGSDIKYAEDTCEGDPLDDPLDDILECADLIVFGQYRSPLSGDVHHLAYTLHHPREESLIDFEGKQWARVDAYCRNHPEKHVRVDSRMLIYPCGKREPL